MYIILSTGMTIKNYGAKEVVHCMIFLYTKNSRSGKINL